MKNEDMDFGGNDLFFIADLIIDQVDNKIKKMVDNELTINYIAVDKNNLNLVDNRLTNTNEHKRQNYKIPENPSDSDWK